VVDQHKFLFEIIHISLSPTRLFHTTSKMTECVVARGASVECVSSLHALVPLEVKCSTMRGWILRLMG
jgi:hypothetical protein